MAPEKDSKKGKNLAVGANDTKFAQSGYDQRPFVCQSIVRATVKPHNGGLQREFCKAEVKGS